MRWFSTDPHEPGFFAVGQIAVGVIAFGQSALGVVAIGQLARGVFSVGQGAVGVVAIGQGALGLWHSTGMVAVGGQSGYGLVLHLVPRVVAEAPPALPETTDVAALRAGAASAGWLAAHLEPEGTIANAGVPVDCAAIAEKLSDAARRGLDRAHVLVRARVEPDASGYRASAARVDLAAEDVIAYRASPRRYLSYARPPGGKPGPEASFVGIAARTVVWLGVFCVAFVVAFEPLFEALLGF